MTPVAASLIASMASSLIQIVASSLINAITGKRVKRAGKELEGGFLPLIALPLMMKGLEKESQEQEEEDITKCIIWIKFFSSIPSFKQYQITTYFNHEPRFNGVFSRHDLSKIKNGPYDINPDDKKVKEHIGFLYSLTKTQVRTFILLRFLIFHQVLSKIKDKPFIQNIFRIQEDDCVMRDFIALILYIENMLETKHLLDYTNLFSPNNYKKNDKVIYKYFKDKYSKRKRRP